MTSNTQRTWIFETPETLSAGLGRVVSDNPDLPALPELEEPTDLALGYIYGLKLRFPADLLWEPPNGGVELLERATGAANAGDFSAAFILGVFAGSGESLFFGELVRRARHRDGSTATLGVATDALHVLGELAGIPAAENLFTAFSFDPANVLTGDYPNVGREVEWLKFGPGRPKTIFREGVGEMPADQTTSGKEFESDPVPALFVALVGREAELPGMSARLFLGDTPKVETTDGLVCLFGTLCSLTVVNELINRLMTAYRSLTLPAEGFVWIDDTLDPLKGSELACLDPFQVGALGLPWSPEKGICISARIHQNDAGEYLAVVSLKDGGVLNLPPEADLNVAKVEVCKVMAGKLKDLGL